MSQWSFSAVRVHLTAGGSTAVTRGVTHTPNVLALLLLPILCLVGLIGNAMVCIAIATDRRLHNVTNYFLFSLALADLLVCLLVMPLSIIVEVKHGVWTWNVSLCLLYVYADVFLCSASIVHMSVISLDRYLGISQPLRTRNKSKTMIIVKICLVWIITLIVSCPIAVLASYDHTYILQNNSCMIFSRHYIIYGSTLTFLIPFCVMFVTYLRTTTLLNKQASILSQKANDKLNGNGLRRTMPHRKLGHVRTNSSSTAATFTSSAYKSSINGPKTSTVSYSNGYHNSVVELEAPPRMAKNSGLLAHKSLAKRSTINRWKSRTSSYLSNIALRVGRRNSLQAASQELANEHKATRVLAVVFICFFICWTPFFVANFIVGFCGTMCSMPPWLGSVFLWLGYISSTVNPIIYTVFNKRFRQAFVRILRCQCCHAIRDPSSLYSRNYTTIAPDTFTWLLYGFYAVNAVMLFGIRHRSTLEITRQSHRILSLAPIMIGIVKRLQTVVMTQMTACGREVGEVGARIMPSMITKRYSS
ncbi:7 transmembrane receptor [Ancylostoma caninum]|uniref:7 transmembrane receptor n=2 Tax=Ancylostoma TaxID=29169 RepID=A0A368F8Q8_ANCCA|nr:7 transmembrane receptor [Ancylostoma caninum]